jgi:Na+-driven multidrug efflux pump
VSTLLRLAVPNAVVNLVLIAVTASVDAHFVGRLGPSALAGLSLVFPLLMLMQQMANASMGGAIASAVARAVGSGRREDASALVAHALLIAGGMAAIFTSVFLLGGPTIYALMGGSGATLAAAVEYSNAIFAGAGAYWLLSALTSVVRGAGQPAVLAVTYLAAEALHVVLVPTLVFGVGPIPLSASPAPASRPSRRSPPRRRSWPGTSPPGGPCSRSPCEVFAWSAGSSPTFSGSAGRCPWTRS